jgi:hypothetical protein
MPIPEKNRNCRWVGRWDSNVSATGEAYGDLAAITGDINLLVPHRITLTTDASSHAVQVTFLEQNIQDRSRRADRE